MSHQNDLLNLLSAQQGHFKLESGHHGSLWLELDRLFLYPRAVHQFAVELAHSLAPYKPNAICGALVGGALIAQVIATELNVEFYYTERFISPQPDVLYPVEYRLPASLRKTIHSKNVAIIDDVINAGSAVRGTLNELRTHNANPLVVASLLILGSSAPIFFAAQNIPLLSIATLENNLWEPSQCPLCVSQIPLQNVTEDTN